MRITLIKGYTCNSNIYLVSYIYEKATYKIASVI